MTPEQRSLSDVVAGVAARGTPEAALVELHQLGITTLGVPVERGGSGGDLTDVLVALASIAPTTSPVPLAETLLAAALLGEAGLRLGSAREVAVAAPGLHARPSEGSHLVYGTLDAVPWGDATCVLNAVVTRQRKHLLVRLDRSDYSTTGGTNLADEPRDAVHVRGVHTELAELPPAAFRRHELRAALLKAFLVSGAADAAVDLAVRHAAQRQQFGRPIGGFQAVQQMLAAAVGEVSALRTTCWAAARMCSSAELETRASGTAVAATKAQASVTATVVARVAHQVHGAIGLTQEHPLGRLTKRLWAWRDEAGDERSWAGALASIGLEEDGLWSVLTEMS